MTEHVFGDMSEEFEFDEGTIDYVDEPLSGWLRRRSDGAWFAFDCQPVVAGMLWHWTLVPVAEQTSDVREVLQSAAKSREGSWISISEDRRADTRSTCRLVTIDSKRAPPVLMSIRARLP